MAEATSSGSASAAGAATAAFTFAGLVRESSALAVLRAGLAVGVVVAAAALSVGVVAFLVGAAAAAGAVGRVLGSADRARRRSARLRFAARSSSGGASKSADRSAMDCALSRAPRVICGSAERARTAPGLRAWRITVKRWRPRVSSLFKNPIKAA